MAIFRYNTDYSLVNILQHFNIGYFTYDLAHVLTWDRKFLGHHVVAIAGSTSPSSYEVASHAVFRFPYV